MEDLSSSTSGEETWAAEITQTLDQQRTRVREFLAAQRSRLDQAQIQLAQQIEQISASLDRDRAETAQAKQEIETRSEQVQSRLDALAQLKEDIETRQDQWTQTHREALGQYESLAERLKHQQESEAAELASQLRAQIDQQCGRLQQQTEELSTALAGQKDLSAEIEAGRRREAELHNQIEALRRQCDELREEASQAATEHGVDHGQLEALCAERDELAQRLKRQQESEAAELAARLRAQIDQQCERLQEQTASLHAALAEQKDLAAEIEAGRRREAELHSQIEALRRQCDEFREEASQAATEHGVDFGQLETLRAEREALRAERDELTERLKRQQESEAAELASQLRAQIDQQCQRLQEQTAELHTALAGQKELSAEIEASRRRETELHNQIEAFRRQCDELREEASQAAKEHGVDFGQLEAVRAEREALRTERDELARRLERQQESEAAELAAQLRAQIDQQCQRLQQQTEELRTSLAGQKEISAEIEAGRCREAELHTQIEALRQQYDQLRQDADQAAEAGGAGQARVEALRAERDALAERLGQTQTNLEATAARLSEVERQLAEAPPAGDDSGGEMRRRYEMAMEDLRELRTRNEALDQELAQARKSRASAVGVSTSGLDWESQKQRILESLESDAEQDGEEEQDRRLEIEDVVQKTDEIVAERDREIEELKQLLHSQSEVHSSVAVGAAALGEIFDKDAVIQEEREKLCQLQSEWKEKLRQAELELSVERAKVARERTKLDEQRRALDERAANAGSEADPTSTAAREKEPRRGRWLARLGLKDGEQE